MQRSATSPRRKRGNGGDSDTAPQDFAAPLRRRLLGWFRRNRRDLPWRRTRDPYAIWLSEIMLQQTQVATVIPYFERFLSRFPTVGALADAPLEEVLRLWSGLGYYARARHMHAAAKLVVADHDGRFPDTVEGLSRLPGVGRYTAAAIASIAFDRRAAVLDGNVARVLARLFAVAAPLKATTTRNRLWALAESLTPAHGCGDFNQAMMELGALVCTPAAPRCASCPIRPYCRAASRGIADRLPVAAAERAPRTMRVAVLAVRRNGCWLFEPRPASGLWGGLWHLPSEVLDDGEPSDAAVRRIARRVARGVNGSIDVTAAPLGEVRRRLTHRVVTFVVHAGHIARSNGRRAEPPRSVTAQFCWCADADLTHAPLSTAMRSVVALANGLSGGPEDFNPRART